MKVKRSETPEHELRSLCSGVNREGKQEDDHMFSLLMISLPHCQNTNDNRIAVISRKTLITLIHRSHNRLNGGFGLRVHTQTSNQQEAVCNE